MTAIVHHYERFSYSMSGILIRLHCSCGWKTRPHLYWKGARRKLSAHENKENSS